MTAVRLSLLVMIVVGQKTTSIPQGLGWREMLLNSMQLL
jgi:hypothetical protein